MLLDVQPSGRDPDEMMALQEEYRRLREELEAERSRGFWHRLGVNKVLRALFLTFGGLTVYVFVVAVVLANGWGFSDKELFDWLDILIFPAVVAVGVYLLSLKQNQRDRAADERQRQRELRAEEQRRQNELEIEEQRAREAALQSYLDQMANLLIDHKLHSETNPYGDKCVTARARSLAALRRLDGNRKRSVLQFLYEAQLINKEEHVHHGRKFEARVVGLDGAELTGANLRYITLRNAALDGAILENADLRDAKLNHSDLGGAYLSGADLRSADLRGAKLVGASFQRKDELNLAGADLSGAFLNEAKLRDGKMGDVDLSHAILNGADLIRADLSGATLHNAFLERADLRGANLKGADLRDADLHLANVTKKQLETTRSLTGVTMPDGTKHD